MEETAPGAEPEAAAEGLVPAGFWVRAGAFMLDWFVITCVQLPTLFLVKRLAPADLEKNASMLANLVVFIVYMAGAPVMLGKTLGKRVAGLDVLTVDGGPIEPKRSLGRSAALLFSLGLSGLGCIMAAFSDRKRGLHDFMAGTVVVYALPVRRWRQALMVVIALAVPAAFAAMVVAFMAMNPRMKELVQKSGEGATKGNLGALRSMASIYYGDHEGVYPPDLSFYKPRDGGAFPRTRIAAHPGSDRVELYGDSACDASDRSRPQIRGGALKDSGGWGYVADSKSPCWGTVFVDCTHQDSKGKEWFAW